MALDTRRKSVLALENIGSAVGPSKRAVRTTFAVLAITVQAIFLLFEWPGYLTNHCGAWGVATESIHGHSYCYETVLLTRPTSGVSTNGSWNRPPMTVGFWSFTFHLARYMAGDAGGTSVSVVEPNGTTIYGTTLFGGPVWAQRDTWIAPDNESGIYQPSFHDSNITLYVEIGT
jgi:hypothetical protein